MSAASWYNNPESSAASWYAAEDPYFIRPEFGAQPVRNVAEGALAFAANDLLGIDDLRRAWGRAGAGDWGGALRSLGTGGAELGLTIGATMLGGPAGLAARAASATARFGGAARLLRSVYQTGRRVPIVRGGLGWLRRRGRLGTIALGLGIPAALKAAWDWEGGGAPEAEEEAAAAGADGGFTMNLPGAGGAGGRGRAGVPSLDMSFIDSMMPLSDYQDALDFELANLEARSGAYSTALDEEWSRISAVNLAAVDKAERLAAAAGEEGFAAWDRAAQGALDVTATRNAALLQMAGGMPQAEAPGGAAQDFARFAQAAGESERQLQQTLGENRAEDYRYMAQVAEQTGAGYQSAVARAEQDAAAAAVARHNQQVIARNQMIAQMQFQAAMQQQQLAAQASIANARDGGAGSLEEVIGTAVALADRQGGNAGAILFQLFPGVFPTEADAAGFIASLGSPNPFG